MFDGTVPGSGVQQLLEASGPGVGHLDDLGAARGAADQSDLARPTAERLGERFEGGRRGPPVHGGNLHSHHEGGVAVASADPGASRAGLDPDLETNGYTRRRTATTLPRMDASLPSIGS